MDLLSTGTKKSGRYRKVAVSEGGWTSGRSLPLLKFASDPPPPPLLAPHSSTSPDHWGQVLDAIN